VQNSDFALKKKLLDAWDITENFHDARGDIVIDVFEDEVEEDAAENSSDKIIFLPFFSDEVLSLDDIPEDTNRNFVEINSATDLLAMENPHQKKYKTESLKIKTNEHKKQPPRRKTHNNWAKFKNRFPVYVERGFAPAARSLPDTGIPIILPPRKEKRQAHYYPVHNIRKIPEEIPRDPWKNVNIVEDKVPQLAFGAYDELGNKIQKKMKDEMTGKHYEDPHKTGHSVGNKKEIGNHEQIISITIDLDKIEPTGSKTPHPSDRVVGFKQFQQQQHTTFQSENSVGHKETEAAQVPELQTIRATIPPRQEEENTGTKASPTPFTVFASNVIQKFKDKQTKKRTTKAPVFKDFAAVRKKKFAPQVFAPVKIPIAASQDAKNVPAATTPLPVFQVFQANKENKDKAERLVFTVFSPNSDSKITNTDTKQQPPSTEQKKQLDPEGNNLPDMAMKNQLGKRIDNLYKKLATLANFEAFKGSPSDEVRSKIDQPPRGVSKLVKPVEVLMKNEKLKLTKPVVLNLQNVASEKTDEVVQSQLLLKLKNQVQSLKEQKQELALSQPNRPKRARLPKPEGSPKHKEIVKEKDPPKNSSHKRDLKLQMQTQTEKSQSEKEQNSKEESSLRKLAVMNPTKFSSVPKIKHNKATEQQPEPSTLVEMQLQPIVVQ